MSIHTVFAAATPLGMAGQLDQGFACGGKAHVVFPDSLSCMANSIAVDPKGRLLVGAKVTLPAGNRFGMARLNADGSADVTFGHQGSVVGQFETDCEATGGTVHLLSDGRILLAGLHYESAHRTLPALALFDKNGQPDLRFGTQGVQVVRLPGDLSVGRRDDWLPPGIPGAEACPIQVQLDGRILILANHHYELADHVGVLIRLEPHGALDTSFNGRGFLMVRRLLMNTWLGSLLLQRNGRIVVGGSIDLPQKGLLVRFEADGSLDNSFADHGYFSFKAEGRSAQVSQVIEHLDGHLHGFGSSRDPMQCMSLTLRGDGLGARAQLDEIGSSHCQWTAAQRLDDGRVLTAGATIGGIEADFILARHWPDGRLDLSFGGGNGWVRTRLGRSLDTATSLAVQADGAIVVAGYSLDGNYRAVVARYLG
ncbi:hypothetical protein [Pseudomonas purpurea]|uniref:hypothetical protein n=1 Tax=Pseudomonas purpurea TaxID=3136737 RepID=UPI003264DB4A